MRHSLDNHRIVPFRRKCADAWRDDYLARDSAATEALYRRWRRAQRTRDLLAWVSTALTVMGLACVFVGAMVVLWSAIH